MTQVIGHAGIAARIPHAGRMCLLDRVVSWDAGRIVCHASSHRSADHPMAQDGRLDAVCGVEYAAQAMAMHGALTGNDGPSRGGYLASLRAMECFVSRLDDLPDDLVIEVESVMQQDEHAIYRFTLTSGGAVVVSGRAAVVLQVST